MSNFLNAMHISCYSFTALAQRAEKIMPNGSSLLTLFYYGAEKVMPNYNVMGLCKAALICKFFWLHFPCFGCFLDFLPVLIRKI